MLAAFVAMLASSPALAQGQGGGGRAAPVESIDPSVRGKDCLTSGCHAVLVEPKYVHEPVVRVECNRCHEETDSKGHQFRMSAEPPAQCLACHEEVAADLADPKARPHRHKPVDEGRCLDCHEPHASNHQTLLRAPNADLCLRCHEDTSKAIAALAHAHAPAEQKECAACHTAHASPHDGLLVERFAAERYVAYDEGQNYALCFECHDSELLEDEETDEYTNFRNGEQNLHYLHVNRESKGRSCRICHLPHGSDQHRLIRPTVPFGNWKLNIRFIPTENGGYCGPACHPAKRYDRLVPVDWNKEPVAPREN